MKKSLGSVLILTALLYETIYTAMTYLPILTKSPLLVSIMQYVFTPTMNVVTTLFRLTFVLGVFIYLKKESLVKRLSFSFIILFLIMPTILTVNFEVKMFSWFVTTILFYLSSILGFLCLFAVDKLKRYLVIVAHFILMIFARIVIEIIPISWFQFFAIIRMLLSVGILLTFVLGKKLNVFSRFKTLESEKKKQIRSRVKKTSVILFFIVFIISLQAFVRTESHEVMFNTNKPFEYERYSDEVLTIKVKTSPILFNLYFVHGTITVHDDTYKINDFIGMHALGDDKDYVRFDLSSTVKYSDEKIKLNVNVMGDKKSELYRDIFVYMVSDNKETKERHQESLTYRLKK